MHVVWYELDLPGVRMSDARRTLIVRRTDACRTHEPKRTHTNDLPRATYDFFCVRLRTTIVQYAYAKKTAYDNSVIRTTHCRTYDGRDVRLSYDISYAQRTPWTRGWYWNRPPYWYIDISVLWQAKGYWSDISIRIPLLIWLLIGGLLLRWYINYMDMPTLPPLCASWGSTPCPTYFSGQFQCANFVPNPCWG